MPTLYLDERLVEQPFGDDLESIGYMLCYFAYGSLFWQGLKAPTDKERNELLKEKKCSWSHRVEEGMGEGCSR
ncbi:hypothetical protein V8F06_000888 [Rhypophila decipiens]